MSDIEYRKAEDMIEGIDCGCGERYENLSESVEGCFHRGFVNGKVVPMGGYDRDTKDWFSDMLGVNLDSPSSTHDVAQGMFEIFQKSDGYINARLKAEGVRDFLDFIISQIP